MLKLLEPMSGFLAVIGLLGAGAAQAADDSITADAGVDYRAEVAGPEIVELLRQAPASAPLLGMLQEDGAPLDEASKLSRFHEGPIDEWVVDIQPYIWLPGKVSLDSTVAGATVPIEMDLGDIFSNFGVFAISGRLEAYHGSWGLMSDGLYVRLRSKSDNLPPQLSSVNVDQGIVDLAVAWRAFAVPIGDGGMRLHGTLYGGARFWYLKQEITPSVFAPIPPITLGGSERWVEPMIQGRLSLDVTDWLTLAFRADASGFGVGSATDLTWNVMAGGAISFGEGFSVNLGYRYFNVDYDAKAPAFGLNGDIHGPYIGFSFKF